MESFPPVQPSAPAEKINQDQVLKLFTDYNYSQGVLVT